MIQQMQVSSPAVAEWGQDVTAEMRLPQPYLLFMGDVAEPAYAKTALGLRDWARECCVGEYSLPGARVSTGLPRLSAAQAVAAGARSMVIGVAPRGGNIEPHWEAALIGALAAGMDLVSGLHTRLMENDSLVTAARRFGRRLFDVRVPPAAIPVGSGRKRSGKRLLTVGTDCALGKKYTALAISRELNERGVPADFRATGQTGIMISGRGIPMDAVVADFLAGAAEILSPDAPSDHWDIIEGQGSLFHPSYAGVSLGLLHGSQPDVVVVCHDPSRKAVLGTPDYVMPTLRETIEVNLLLGKRVNPSVRCAGISLNTAALPAEEAEELLARTTAALGLPCADPVKGGARFSELVEACLDEAV